MNWRHLTVLAVLVFLLQFLLSEYLTIRQIRPDFILILVMYVALKYGSAAGVTFGFFFGLIEDLLSAGSLLGLAPLTKSITGFLIGRLQGKYHKMNPVFFHGAWISIILIHFVFYVYVRFQGLYESSQPVFWKSWFFVVVYTSIFVGIMQAIAPFHRVKAPK